MTLEILVVAIARFDIQHLCRIVAGRLAYPLANVIPVHTFHVTTYRLAAKRHGAIDPNTDFRIATTSQVTAVAIGNIDGQRHLAALHAAIEIGIVGQCRALHEIARAGDIGDVVAALRALIAVKCREAQPFDIEG